PKHGKATGVPVVEDLDDLGLFIREAKVALVDDEGAPEEVKDPENRGDCRGAARKRGLVAERSHRQKKPRLPGPSVTFGPEVRKFVEVVVEPAEEHVVGCKLLEEQSEV